MKPQSLDEFTDLQVPVADKKECNSTKVNESLQKPEFDF